MDSFEFPFHFERHANHSVVSLNPLINEGQWGTVTEVGTEILAHLETQPGQPVIVNLSRLNYIGSPQVALLVRLWKSLKRSQGRMAVECPSAMVCDVLTTAGLKSIWQIVETRSAALEAVGIRHQLSPLASLWNWLSYRKIANSKS